MSDGPSVVVVVRDPTKLARRRAAFAGLPAAQYVSDAREVITLANDGLIDAVVADAGDLLSDHLALLTQLRTTYPSIARIALVPEIKQGGVTDRVSQIVLPDAAPLGQLVEATARASAVARLTGSPAVTRVIRPSAGLPTLPQTYFALSDAMNTPGSTVGDLTTIIERDPGLGAKVLQLANAAVFGMARRIASLPDAIARLGTEQLAALVMGVHVFRGFRGLAESEFSLEAFQANSMRVARLASRFGQRAGHADLAFTAGLLSDLGKLLLATQAAPLVREVAARAPTTPAQWCEVERELIGAAHAEVGAGLLDAWGLPFALVEAVTFHHAPRAVVGPSRAVAATVHAADAMLGIVARGEPEATLDVALLEELGFGSVLPQWRAWAEQDADQLKVA